MRSCLGLHSSELAGLLILGNDCWGMARHQYLTEKQLVLVWAQLLYLVHLLSRCFSRQARFSVLGKPPVQKEQMSILSRARCCRA